MNVKTASRAVIFVGLTASLSAVAPPKAVLVQSTVLDYAADIAPALQIRSDGAVYPNSKTLVSNIQAIGDWELDAINPRGATRQIYLSFSQPVAGSGPGGSEPVNLPSGIYKFRALAQCSGYGNSLLAFSPGATKVCPLRIGFDYNEVRYAIVMNPDLATTPNGPFPTTNPANVTCIFPTSGSAACSQWKFTPSGIYIAPDSTVKYRNVGKLLQFSGNQTVTQDHGDFYFSFSILVAKS